MNHIHFKVINRLGCPRIDSGQGLFEEGLMISMRQNLARIHKQRKGKEAGREGRRDSLEGIRYNEGSFSGGRK